jgi:hypothetical protein
MPDVDKQTAVDEVIAKLGLNPVRTYLWKAMVFGAMPYAQVMLCVTIGARHGDRQPQTARRQVS